MKKPNFYSQKRLTRFLSLYAMCMLTLLSFNPIYATGGQIEVQISNGSDDAEENLADGVVSTGSTDLELITDGSKNQLVGLRFPNICLLYTSPSPRDATLSRMPSSA